MALLPAVGQGQIVEWARSDGGTSHERAFGITVDANGNSYVAGRFEGTATFGAFTLTSSAGTQDIFVAKYDADGNVLWARSAGGTEVTMDEQGNGIAVDVAGNTYVTGKFVGTAVFGSFSITSAGQVDIFVAKYDASGNVLWARSDGGGSGDRGEDIAVDAAGNSYVTGVFFGRATFGPFTLTSVGFLGTFVAKYDSAGNVLWARSGGGGSSGIAVDAGGNSYVTGAFFGTATFGAFTLISAGSSDVFVAKYDSGGNVLWAQSAGGASLDGGKSIAVDVAGNSYLTGRFGVTASFGSFTLTTTGQLDIFVAKYDSSGNVLWARSAGGTLTDRGWGIAVDIGGNAYITGHFGGTATFGPFTLISLGTVVAKYDSAGNVLWARSGGGGSSGIAVDAGGNAYITGHFGGTATFCPFMLTSAGELDIFVAKYVVFPECGNGNIDPCEQCDGGLGCVDCHCPTGFEPTAPPSLDCLPTVCGDGTLNLTAGEECDGGVGCTDCLCDSDFEPTAPPSPDCQPRCGDGGFDPGEECDGGLGCADCLCLPGFEPMPQPFFGCQPTTCGNDSVDPGEQCDGLDDSACPGACLSDCTCGLFCGNGACNPGEDSCNCPDDCGAPPSNEVLGATCADGNDNDCDGLTDSADPDCGAIPTVSAWGLIVMALLLLAGIAIKFGGRQPARA